MYDDIKNPSIIIFARISATGTLMFDWIRVSKFPHRFALICILPRAHRLLEYMQI